jgi:hypothetical protein
VSNELDSQTARIWACVHGQCDAQVTAALKAEAGRDPAVRAALDAAHAFDRRLRAVVPALEWTDESLVDGALAAWERETPDRQEAAQPAAATPARSRWRVIHGRALFRHPTFRTSVAGLAAAAAVLLVVLPHPPPSGILDWRSAEFRAAAFRGAAAVPSTVVRPTARDAVRCKRALQAALDRELSSCQNVPAGLVMHFRLQEIAGGAFSVTVWAVAPDGRTVGEWTGDYSGATAFASRIVPSARRIAAELASEAGSGTAPAAQPCAP